MVVIWLLSLQRWRRFAMSIAEYWLDDCEPALYYILNVAPDALL